MDGWTVTLTIGGSLAVEAADDLEVALNFYGPSIALGEDDWRITLAIEDNGVVGALRAIGFAAQLVEKELNAIDVLGVEVMTWTEHDRRLAEPAYPELVGVSELASLLGVSKQRASELQSRAGFPRPLQVLASGPVWPRAWVEDFEAGWERKAGRPRKAG